MAQGDPLGDIIGPQQGGAGGGGGWGNLSGGQILGLGGGAAALGGLGFLLGQGPSPLPPQYGELTGQQVPMLERQGAAYNADAAALLGQGQQFTAQGQEALRMAQAGQLTAPQAAELGQTRQGLQNQALQTYAGMGRNFNQDTSAISTQANLDAQVTAMGQKYIQSTIALGLGEVQAGQGFAGLGAQFGQLGLGFETQADQALIEAGKAQLQQNQTYTSALSGAFGALGSLAPSLIKSLGPLLAA